MQEQALIAGMLRGEQSAFEAVIERHQHAIFGFLRARLLEPADAEDLSQEVFLRFYLARARFDTTQLIRPWLLGIARNLLREHVRNTRRAREIAWTRLCLELDELMSDRTGPEDELLDHLPTCVESLGQSAQQAIRWHYSDNHKLAEIGEKLHRSEAAVKLLVFRARQALKRCLDQVARRLTPPS